MQIGYTGMLSTPSPLNSGIMDLTSRCSQFPFSSQESPLNDGGERDKKGRRYRDTKKQTGLGAGCGKKTVSSELGKEETGSVSSQQAIFTHALSFSSAKGWEEGRGRGGAKRESRQKRWEIQQLQTCPHCWLLCCVQYLISQSLESPQKEWKPDTLKGGKMKRRDVHRYMCA